MAALHGPVDERVGAFARLQTNHVQATQQFPPFRHLRRHLRLVEYLGDRLLVEGADAVALLHRGKRTGTRPLLVASVLDVDDELTRTVEAVQLHPALGEK